MAICTDTDKAHLARAIELARKGAGAVKPNPVVGAVVARDGEVLGEGWHERYGGAHAEVNAIEACGLADLDRRDAVRLARAVLPRGQDAAVHRRDPAGGDPARRRRLRRPDREGLRPRPRHPARRGRRGRARRRRARRARAAAQPGLPQARARRAPVGAVQVGDDARRQGRDAHGRLEVDQRRGEPRARAPLARGGRRRRRRHRHGAGRRPAADGAPGGRAGRAGAPAAPRRVRLARAPAAELAARRGGRARCR